MKQRELTKTFIIFSNLLVSMACIKIFQKLFGAKKEVRVVTS